VTKKPAAKEAGSGGPAVANKAKSAEPATPAVQRILTEAKALKVVYTSGQGEIDRVPLQELGVTLLLQWAKMANSTDRNLKAAGLRLLGEVVAKVNAYDLTIAVNLWSVSRAGSFQQFRDCSA
jgi:hypothetical protein